MKQLTVYDFGVEEPEDDYSWLFTTKFDTKELPITINHVDKWHDPKDLYLTKSVDDKLYFNRLFGDIRTAEAQEAIVNYIAKHKDNLELVADALVLLSLARTYNEEHNNA